MCFERIYYLFSFRANRTTESGAEPLLIASTSSNRRSRLSDLNNRPALPLGIDFVASSSGPFASSGTVVKLYEVKKLPTSVIPSSSFSERPARSATKKTNYVNLSTPKDKILWMMNLKNIKSWKINPFVKITPRNFV